MCFSCCNESLYRSSWLDLRKQLIAGQGGSHLSTLPVVGTTELVKKNAELRDKLRLERSNNRQLELLVEQVGRVPQITCLCPCLTPSRACCVHLPASI